MEPPPEVIFTIRGVVLGFLRSGAKASTIRKDPVALVWKHCAICPVAEPDGQSIAALLTSASSLKMLVSTPINRLIIGMDLVAWQSPPRSYLPWSLSAVLAAAAIDSSLAMSSCNSSTAPGCFQD